MLTKIGIFLTKHFVLLHFKPFSLWKTLLFSSEIHKLNIDLINLLIHCWHKYQWHGKDLVLFYIVSLDIYWAVKTGNSSINLPTCLLSHYNCLNYTQNPTKQVYSQPEDITRREDPKQMYEKTHFSTFFSTTTAYSYSLFCSSGCVDVLLCKGLILHMSPSVPEFSSLVNMLCFWSFCCVFC